MKTQLIIMRAVSIVLSLAVVLCIVFLSIHRHSMVHIEAKGASCTESGYAECWYCAGCDKYFSDKDGANETDPAEAVIQPLGHSWAEWQPSDSFHHRTCVRCGQSEYGEHVFSDEKGSLCTVCGHEPQEEESAGGAVYENEANIVVESSRGYRQVYDSDGKIRVNTAGTMGIASVYPGVGSELTFSIYFSAKQELTLSVSFAADSMKDVFLGMQNGEGVSIEYHPVRFTLSLWENESWTVAENCENTTLAEMAEAIAQEAELNRSIHPGENVEIKFKLSWNWAEYIEEPDSFEIRTADGGKYYFADSATSPSQWYLSMMDTALGEAPDKVPSGTVKDVQGNSWTMTGEYSTEFFFDVAIAVQ